MDIDGSGEISFEEFLLFIQERRIKIKLEFDNAYNKKNLEDMIGIAPQVRYIPDLNKTVATIVSSSNTKQQYLDTLKTLLEKKADPNTKSRDGESVLFIAASKFQNIDFVNLLLEHKANPNQTTTTRTTCLNHACSTSNLKIVETLVEHKSDPNISKALEFLDVKKKESLEIAKFLLTKGSKKNDANFYVLKSSSFHFISQIYEEYSDPNQKNKNGENALHYALKKNLDKNVINMLLKKKVDINLKSKTGEQPINKIDPRDIENKTEIIKSLFFFFFSFF